MQDDDRKEVEIPLCPHCAAPFREGEHFCDRCGCPVTFQAVSMPYESILARGFAWREGSRNPQSLIVLVGMWVLFAPALVVSVIGFLALLASFREFDWRPYPRTNFLMALLCLAFVGGMATISGLLLYKTTRNYLRLRRVAEETDSEEDAEDQEEGYEGDGSEFPPGQ
jgi:hypothetical protein